MAKLGKSVTKDGNMDMPFIYVCTVADRERMLALGYQLLASNEKTSLWVFAADDSIKADLDFEVGSYAYGNTMMF